MLAYICVEERGEADRLLVDLAKRLAARGMRLAGAVQTNDEWDPDRACDMNLHVLGEAPRVVLISERLGAEATGCRLNVGALEEVAGLVEAALDGAELLIVNKFGKREAEGGGFRPLIAKALEEGVPVLTAAGPTDSVRFLDWAGDMATLVEPRRMERWALLQAGRGAEAEALD
ncbi:DUF2478 domain-containing protein [Rhodovulum sp. DZ06]|uniref:DUF2478 domain-containing protein n=1 Tax=Rhodovulum sp. DZ06 TaxID=3425126 RepID=UPI003D349D1B